MPRSLDRAGPLPTLIEWDNDLPPWEVLRAEAARAQALIDRARAPVDPRHALLPLEAGLARAG